MKYHNAADLPHGPDTNHGHIPTARQTTRLQLRCRFLRKHSEAGTPDHTACLRQEDREKRLDIHQDRIISMRLEEFLKTTHQSTLQGHFRRKCSNPSPVARALASAAEEERLRENQQKTKSASPLTRSNSTIEKWMHSKPFSSLFSRELPFKPGDKVRFVRTTSGVNGRMGPFKIRTVKGANLYDLDEMDGRTLARENVSGSELERTFTWW
ncbi:hypothetical protein SLS55_010259 [Diplodia seriata]|uniref:Uncharacterized protein n=1 Tax=Diplodia seriata TaxID=420778 RepID=A0ABR3BY27_9PEZI